MRNFGTPAQPGSFRRKSTLTALIGAVVLALVLFPVAGYPAAGASAPANAETGFPFPSSGAPKYEALAPTEITSPAQLNQPLGQAAADKLAIAIGLNKNDVFTAKQYAEFITATGPNPVPVASAKLVDQSVLILTNTVGHPLVYNDNGHVTASVLASYGVFVNTQGYLESPANAEAPTRLVNQVITPGGDLSIWCKANGATKSLAMLYRSAYTLETVYGFIAQKTAIPNAAQLITNNKGGVRTEVGMSMGPALWMVNFALIYTLNPTLAANMPAYWAPIPPTVAKAILASPTGQVKYSNYASYFG